LLLFVCVRALFLELPLPTMSRQMAGSSWFWRRGRTVYTDSPRGESAGSRCCCKVILCILLAVVPLTLYYLEYYQRQLELAFDELETKMWEVDANDPATYPPALGTPVYFTSEYTGSASDPDFGLTLQHALTVQRQTQYCQWREFSTETCDTCTNSDGSKSRCRCSTTYHYHLGWENHPIISTFFDQPFNHHNPLRDPYPSTTIASINTIAGEMSVEPKLLHNTRGPSRAVQFLHPGQAPPAYSFWKFFGWKDTQRCAFCCSFGFFLLCSFCCVLGSIRWLQRGRGRHRQHGPGGGASALFRVWFVGARKQRWCGLR
jgi:hypothetical protein